MNPRRRRRARHAEVAFCIFHKKLEVGDQVLHQRAVHHNSLVVGKVELIVEHSNHDLDGRKPALHEPGLSEFLELFHGGKPGARQERDGPPVVYRRRMGISTRDWGGNLARPRILLSSVTRPRKPWKRSRPPRPGKPRGNGKGRGRGSSASAPPPERFRFGAEGARSPYEEVAQEAPPRFARESAPAAIEIPADAPTRFRNYELNPFQRVAASAIRAGKSVVVAAPTGAGKTLVAEIAIAETIARGKRVVYTSPLKALSNQKFRDFKAAAGTTVGLLTGDVSIDPEAPLLIMTTEILRNEIFDAPERLRDVEVVIFDEVHYLDDFDRGTVWEETILFAPPSIRFVALSATIPNLDQFVRWLRTVHAHPVEQVESSWRPVPLRHFGYHPKVGEFDLQDLDRMRRRVGMSGFRYLDPDLAKGLLNSLQNRELVPVLWFCFSRKECERRARRNGWRNLLTRTEQERIGRLYDETCAAFHQEVAGDLVELRNLTTRGIGYHHAGMLPVHKELVERLFTSGLLKLLFTTETFAMGINMPARTVVFDSLRKFNGVAFDWLRARDYMQMAGRAGRQGIDREGCVVSVLDTEDLHDAPVERIVFGELEPVRSRFNLAYATLLRLIEHLGSRIEEAWERSFNRYQFEEMSPDRREKNRERQLDLLRRKLQFLRETGFIDEGGLTDRGRIAARLSAYEVQFADSLFRGALEELSGKHLAAVFVGIIHEGRKGESLEQPVPSAFNRTKRAVNEVVRNLKKEEKRLLIPEEIKKPDFSLTFATFAWCEGDPIDALDRHTDAAPGDLVRTFRTAIQCLRQLRHALPGSYTLRERLDEAIELLNRDEVDAKRQLELG